MGLMFRKSRLIGVPFSDAGIYLLTYFRAETRTLGVRSMDIHMDEYIFLVPMLRSNS